jgi:putative methyltransferase (TIGR04325 family)
VSLLRSLAKNWLPPAVIGILRRTGAAGIRFEGGFETWDDAAARCTGYDAAEILAKVLDATLKVMSGAAAFERDSVVFDKADHAWPVLAGLNWAAARNGGRLNVLDFGGALGSSYFQGRAFWQALSDVRWNVVEQPHYVKAGQAHIQDERLHFYSTIADCLGDSKPDVVLASSVLQYVADPEKVIDDLKRLRPSTIVIDRTIINHSDVHRIYVQHVPATIYSASYPCRSLSEASLMASMAPDYEMAADFQSLSFPALHSIDSEFKGYIFQKAE